MPNGIIYAINCALIFMRPGMTIEFGFTKWNRCWVVAVNNNPRVIVHMNSDTKYFCEKNVFD